MSKSNANTTNTTIKFDAIEKQVALLTIGTNCTYTKYNDNKNGYIGLKVGRKIVFSMFKLKNENTDTGCKIGCTTDVMNHLKTLSFKNVKFIENGNASDKTRNNLIECDSFKTAFELFKSVITWYNKPVETTATEPTA